MKYGRGEIQPIHVLPELVHDASQDSHTIRLMQKLSQNGDASNQGEKTDDKTKAEAEESSKKTKS